MAKKAVPQEASKPSTLRANDLAAEIGIDPATLYRWLQRGIFPPPGRKVGRTVRRSRAVVEKFISEGVTA